MTESQVVPVADPSLLGLLTDPTTTPAHTRLLPLAATAALCTVGFYILTRWLNPTPKSKSKVTPRHRIYRAQTHHARYIPVRHSFRYPLFYFGVDLVEGNDGDLGEDGGGWFRNAVGARWVGWGRKAVFAIWAKDHLMQEEVVDGEGGKRIGELGRLRLKLFKVLRDFEVDTTDIGLVEFLTTPRVFGYNFNPLSVYYCYDKTNNIRAIVLEVNNTFSERHVYVCDHRNQMDTKVAGYPLSYTLNRSFHVSPFNNRSGTYEAHFTDPLSEGGKMDILLNIKRYTDGSTTPSTTPATHYPIWLTARVYGTSHPLTRTAAVSLLLSYPLTAFLTVPRILLEAAKLRFTHKLTVYQKPGQYAAAPSGKAVKWSKLGGLNAACAEYVGMWLRDVCAKKGVSVDVVLWDGTQLGGVTTSGDSSTPAITIRAITPSFFTTLAAAPTDIGTALLCTFVRGDWTCTSNELRLFLSALRRATSPSPLTASSHFPQLPGFTPLPPPSTALLRVQIAWGLAKLHVAQKLFKSVANFAVDPYDVRTRIEGYWVGEGVADEEDEYEEIEKRAYAVDDGSRTRKIESARMRVFLRCLE
ncbi:uncharacterized protein EV422DRAFT_514791 [Fimicolochytrium jonesii]|uniref:uncharacterized protein n=1 Tax=Fimicolochytrium jonesii TaxID=1396493 RepID=UPI0022FE1448|nr:uncharacterized protein EV422DRAFT_514791 [Fimicolochytrium jonesii]KAI8825949.1 hypothetical protein EV422DRAFT_514791 [Fimicolochytrium jonesii]